MRFRLLCLAILVAVCLACPNQGLTSQPEAKERRLREALWLGMDYMIHSAEKEENFEEYASDYLFFFADVARLDDPWIREEAQRVGRRLGNRYLEKYFSLESADEVVDAASALYALNQLGMDVDLPMLLLRDAARLFDEKDYLGFDPARGEAPDLDQFIDLVIGFHFTDRVGLDRAMGISYAQVLHYLPAVEYRDDGAGDFNRYIDQNNLVTHLFYTLSGYASWNIDGALLPREMAYIRRHMDRALAWADPETLAEYIDSLKLSGYDEQDPDIAHGVDLLLAIQHEDGRWESLEPEDEYDRYHATWCVMDALRNYALDGPDGMPDARTQALLSSWADALAAGRSMGDGLRLAPDKREDED